LNSPPRSRPGSCPKTKTPTECDSVGEIFHSTGGPRTPIRDRLPVRGDARASVAAARSPGVMPPTRQTAWAIRPAAACSCHSFEAAVVGGPLTPLVLHQEAAGRRWSTALYGAGGSAPLRAGGRVTSVSSDRRAARGVSRPSRGAVPRRFGGDSRGLQFANLLETQRPAQQEIQLAANERDAHVVGERTDARVLAELIARRARVRESRPTSGIPARCPQHRAERSGRRTRRTQPHRRHERDRHEQPPWTESRTASRTRVTT
jgi:hypothetical protein